MRNRLPTLLLVFLFFFTRAGAQFVNIPDSNFRVILKAQFPSCFNAQNQLDTTCSAILASTNVNIYYNYPNIITNLDGIQYFKSLKTIDCNANNVTTITTVPALPPVLEKMYISDNKLTSLPALPATMKELYCDNNLLTSLPTLPNSITILYVPNNKLTSLPQLGSNLQHVDCSGNLLTTLPSLPASLQRLYCGSNSLNSLPPLPASMDNLACYANNLSALPVLPPGLLNLACHSNQITQLPSLPNTISTLQCSGNQITNMPPLPANLYEFDCSSNKLDSAFSLIQLPNNLHYLSCSANKLYSLPALPASLIKLNCDFDSLSSLPALPNSLQTLDCSFNKLSSLPLLPNSLTKITSNYNQLLTLPILPSSLTYLSVKNNLLTSLPALPSLLQTLNISFTNIHCLPFLPQSLKLLSLDSSKVRCLPNPVSNQVIYHNGTGTQVKKVKYCNVTNNLYGCTGFPTIRGKVFNDFNNNGIKDANELYRARVRVNLSNNSFTFTNDSGYYELATDTIGSFQVSAMAPAFFAASPSSIAVNFSSYDTSVTKDIALQRTILKDSLSVSITPMLWRARPGFSYPYQVEYKNVGSTDIGATTVVFNYNTSLLNFVSSSNTSAINAGNTVSLSLPSVLYGSSGRYDIYFTVKATAPLGDTLKANAAIIAGSITGVDTTKSIISGAYDPNDKDATPVLRPIQVTNGAYIDYTIRFQNKGTDTAFNVVITDTLSALLQSNLVEMIGSSHSCKTMVNGDKVSFEFRNILLPHQAINDPASHGFVRFRIKPKSTVVIGNTINNKAAIYFDYNSPIITNTATTQIQELAVVGLKLVLFRASRSSNGKNLLYWHSSNEDNMAVFEIEQSVDGQGFIKIGKVNAVGHDNNSYSFNADKVIAPILYYRLKMIDRDGSFAYSPVVVIRDGKEANASFAIESNPIKNMLVFTVFSPSLINTQAKLINHIGVVLKTFTLMSGTQSISVNELPAGAYYLHTQQGSEKIVIIK